MAWTELETILLREGFARDAPQLLERLSAAISAPDAATRRRELDAIAADGQFARLIRFLAAEPGAVARQVALELAARLRKSPDVVLAAWLRPLLRDRRIPVRTRLTAAARLLRATPAAEAHRVFQDFAAGFGRRRLVERQSQLRRRFPGRQRLFDRFVDRLAARLPLSCTRCGVKLRRDAMARHLWDRHRRLLVDGRVRTPWRSLEQWTITGGAAAAHRRLLRAGGVNEVSLARLRRDGRKDNASLCPHCFASVPLDAHVFPSADGLSPLHLAHGRLSGHGYFLELTPSLSGPRLRIETPAGVLFNGPEPDAKRSRNPVPLPVLLLVVLAIALAALLPPAWAVPGSVFTLLAAVWAAASMRRVEPDERPDQVINHAWRLLAPQLTAKDADFLAALAVTSERHGDPLVRDRAVRRRVAMTRSALPVHRVAFQKLQIADAQALGSDAVIALADAVQPCFCGELTPVAAELLLDPDLLAGWTRGRVARLRILLASRAFAAGLGVWDLHALGQAVPQLGRVLNIEDTDGLARLRSLWDQRSARPWRQCGPAATVFELAKFPMLGEQHLETAPDLLLFQPLPAGGEPIHLLACGRGLIVGGGLIHEWPTAIDVRPLPGSKGGGYALRFGSRAVQVHGDVDDVVRKLTAWADYFFREFLPWIGNALTRSGDSAVDRIGPLTVRCPECRAKFVGRPGALGRRVFPESSRPTAADSA
ncbi:MAG TPA: hypothetical protein VH120_21105 [Gemmataceae bacterium]|jgi:hypothetical protein|nr:hypothetical protein [Gemmataceae bacterium]